MHTLKQFVNDSDLSADKKEVWNDIFETMGDEKMDMFDPVLDFLKEHPDRLEKVTENIMMKRDMLASDNEDDFEKIIDQEVALLS